MDAQTHRPRTRRAMLTTLATGAAAALVARPSSVRSGTDYVVLGGINTTGSTTELRGNPTAGTLLRLDGPETAIEAQSDQTTAIVAASIEGHGVVGKSGERVGVQGSVWADAATGEHIGVRGHSETVFGTGVVGECSIVPAIAPANVGVYGYGGLPGSRGIVGESGSDGVGVLGDSRDGIGVYGTSGSGDGHPALMGHARNDGSGVQGYSGGPALPGPAPARVGVYGYAGQDPTARGVFGHSNIGRGVHGHSGSGTGVLATAATGVALEVTGRAVFSRSGRATIAAGAQSVTVAGIALKASSLALATLQQDRPGIHVRSAVRDVAAGSIRITLNAALSTPTTVGWFVVN